MILKNTSDVDIQKVSGSGESKPYQQDVTLNLDSRPILTMIHGDAGIVDIYATIIGDDDTYYPLLEGIDVADGTQHIQNIAMSMNCKYKITYTGASNLTIAVDNVIHVD